MTKRYYHFPQDSPVSQVLKSQKTVLLDFPSTFRECVGPISESLAKLLLISILSVSGIHC